jgi:hypothetical protein
VRSSENPQPERLDIKPRLRVWHLYGLFAFLLALGASLPAFFLFDDWATRGVVAGVIYVGLWFIFLRFAPVVSMTLTPAGIELRRVVDEEWGSKADEVFYRTSGFWGSGGGIPWSDVEEIATFDSGWPTKFVGVRVRSLTGYLASLPPAPAPKPPRESRNEVGGMVIEILALRLWIDIFTFLIGTERGARSPAEALIVNRDNYGYEFIFGFTDRDRSPEAFAELLRSYALKA